MHEKQIAIVVVLLISVLSMLVRAEPPSVSPWISPPLTPGNMAALTAELNRLEEILSDGTLGSQRIKGGSDWDSHAFAQYTGGVLASLGYTVRLATHSHWPDGSHSWVLVNLATSAVSPAWVPVEVVEVAPPLGSRQLSLGAVATQSVSATNIVFDPRYDSFESVSELASNRSPIARIRLRGSTLLFNEPSVITALGSSDDDGMIVVYRWKLGDGEWFTTRSWSTTITPTTIGLASITLQVIDNQGANATESIQVEIIGRPDDVPQPPDCGCSK